METGNSVTFDGSGGTGGRGRRLESRRRFAEGFVGAVVTGGMTICATSMSLCDPIL